ncbi:hypothetical protein DDB_G0287767 [Dictyostelium discoideum AX4]|uniref:Uncharacterized protein n=1 Tax=Dictyostelium discoideum TaxID=44689 RepID=Q54JW1_DICDI|nr:hypothetical protein DDB_G0287767 [Dictyostelium discoideum AX4]EAL63530.1 hypothetical protein DDB_G0287767 [Dictyostelium discoideum AX4]|eukprot:XP_637041.1 hypothetical protein DDB_G0287767 [Dictyostelium discoideum AX4]
MFASPLEKMAIVIQSKNSDGMIIILLLNDIYIYLPILQFYHLFN